MVSVLLDTTRGEVIFLQPMDSLFPNSARCLFEVIGKTRESVTLNPGFLFPKGPGPHSVTHCGAKGHIQMSGCRDEENTRVFYSFTDPWGSRSQTIVCHEIQDMPGFYNPQPLLDVDLLNSYEAALYTPWYYGNNYHVSVTLSHFSYRSKYFNRPRYGENDGSETEYDSYEVDIADGIVTFRCHGRRRSHMSGFKQPPVWGEWQDISDRDFQFIIHNAFYSTLMSAFRQIELNSLEIQIALDVAKCAYYNTSADLTHCIAEAASQCDLIDMNNVENASQMSDISGLLPISDFLKLARNYDDPMQWIKSTASLYLYWKYAVKPTVSDVRLAIDAAKGRIKSAYDGERPQSFRARLQEAHDDGFITTCGATVTVEPSYRKDVLAKSFTALDKLGLSLTPSNAWDLVPYSFVLDWFTNVDDILGSISMYCHPYRFSVKNIATYTKTVKLVSVQDETFSGSYTASDYVRSNSSLFPPLRLQGRDAWRSHKFEGAALIIGQL